MKAIIFDFDYTLGDSSEGIVESINYALQKSGYTSRPESDIVKTIGYSMKDTFRILTGNDDNVQAKKFATDFKERADAVMVEYTELYPSVYELLNLIKSRGCKIAIVTSKFHYRIEQILLKFELTSQIDAIVGAEDVVNAKPAPDGLLSALDMLNVSAADCIYIGDSIVDAEAAQKAAVPFVGVLTGATEKVSFKSYPSIYIARNLCEVKDFLSKGILK